MDGVTTRMMGNPMVEDGSGPEGDKRRAAELAEKKAAAELHKSQIARRLLIARTALNLSMTEFCTGAGISLTTYSNWEGGRQRLSADGAFALRRTYKLSLEWLFFGEDEDKLPSAIRDALKSSPSRKS